MLCYFWVYTKLTQLYVYIDYPFSTSFPIEAAAQYQAGFPVLYSRSLPVAPVVQLLSHVRLFATQWTPLSFTVSQSLLRFMSVELVMPSNHLILYRPFLLLPSVFPIIRVFSNVLALLIRQPIGTSASVLPMNLLSSFPLGLTGLISLLSKILEDYLFFFFL